MKNCPDCRAYLETMQAEDRQLDGFFAAMQTDMDHRAEKSLASLNPPLAEQTIKTISKQRTIMQSKITKFVAAAVIIIVVIIGIGQLDTPFDASQAFAQAMDKVLKAQTFSCIFISETPYSNGEEKGTYLRKVRYMFKRPDRTREEQLTSSRPHFFRDVRIRDYSRRQELLLRPADMTATLDDKMYDYTMDDTGVLRPSEFEDDISFSMYEDVLEAGRGMVEDLGMVELAGQLVRLLQSHKGSWTVKAWVELQTKKPVQVTFISPGGIIILYESIEIDAELDDELFSLEPPEGYDLSIQSSDPKGWGSAHKIQMGTKIRSLATMCVMYLDNEGDWPNELGDLARVGMVSAAYLVNLLAAPDDPGGASIIHYHKPAAVSEDVEWGYELMLYEDPDPWPEGGIVAGFPDQHTQIIAFERIFEQYLGAWPLDQKKLSFFMIHLQEACFQFAGEHGGRFPQELADLEALDDWPADKIAYFQSASGEPDGPAVIGYRRPGEGVEASEEVLLYEIVDGWPEVGAVVCFMDGNCEIITVQKRFKELLGIK